MINLWRKRFARTKAVKQDNPLKMETMIGAQASLEQMEKIKSYLDLGKKRRRQSSIWWKCCKN